MEQKLKDMEGRIEAERREWERERQRLRGEVNKNILLTSQFEGVRAYLYTDFLTHKDPNKHKHKHLQLEGVRTDYDTQIRAVQDQLRVARDKSWEVVKIHKDI